MVYLQSPSFCPTSSSPFTARIQPTKANPNIKKFLDFEISNSQDFFKQNIVLTNNQGDKDTIYDADINFKIKEINSSVKIPLSFTRGKFFSSFLSSKSISGRP